MYEPSTHKNWQAHLLYHTLSPTLTLIHPLTHLHPPSHPYKTSHLLGLADPLTPPLSPTFTHPPLNPPSHPPFHLLGLADPHRLLINGGSAGGFTTLAVLAFRPGVFAAGARYNEYKG